MVNSYEIKCINKRERPGIHERIQNIGGVNADGSRWLMSEADAIAGIHANRWRFHVAVRGKYVAVIIATHNGREYLKTEADSTTTNNLLSLPECP